MISFKTKIRFLRISQVSKSLFFKRRKNINIRFKREFSQFWQSVFLRLFVWYNLASNVLIYFLRQLFELSFSLVFLQLIIFLLKVSMVEIMKIRSLEWIQANFKPEVQKFWFLAYTLLSEKTKKANIYSYLKARIKLLK